jgi:hypothetical protein
LSSYKITLKPGGVSGRNVGVGVRLQKKAVSVTGDTGTALEVVPAPTVLEVTIIHPIAVTTQSVQITGPDAFDQTITESTEITPIAAGDYVITAAPVTGYAARVFTSPATVIDAEKTCAFVIYDANQTGGGGGDCTPTCPVDGLRFLPLGTDPSFGQSINAFDLMSIPDAAFTVDANTIFDAQIEPGSTGAYTVYCRFFGTVCPTSKFDWNVSVDSQPVNSNNFAYVTGNFNSIGNTAAMSFLARQAVATVSGGTLVQAGTVGITMFLMDTVNGNPTNICGADLGVQFRIMTRLPNE